MQGVRQVTDQVGVELTDLLLCEDYVLAVLPPPRHVLVLKGDEAVIRVVGELLPASGKTAQDHMTFKSSRQVSG